MPNHVINKITFSCDERRLAEILEAIKCDQTEEEPDTFGTITFQKVIPMPEELNVEHSTKLINAIEVYLTFKNPGARHFGKKADKMKAAEFRSLLGELNQHRVGHLFRGYLFAENLEEDKLGSPAEEMIEAGKQAIENFKKYGAISWYEWRTSPENWNTKWDAYDCEYTEGEFLQFLTAWTAPHPIIRKISAMFPDVEITHKWADEDIGYNCGQIEYKAGNIVAELEFDCRASAEQFAQELWDKEE